MPSFNVKQLLQDLKADVSNILHEANELKQLPRQTLLIQPATDKWNVAQILEHLNAYNRYYLDAIEKGLANNTAQPSQNFKSGWFGNYFTKMMQPKESGAITNKMSAPKAYVFSPDLEVEKVMDEFIHGQQKLLQFLDEAERVNIGKIRLPISISKMIKLKMGDTFRFLIAHQQRHFVQINNTLNAIDEMDIVAA